MAGAPKGTVTSLASLFPAEEAQKAAKRVQDAISEKEKELEHIRGFIADNNNLINLVQKLPEELHHDIMVPFGKAAFFPGRLIHTNEFLVLLGEGYYAERTSKQTIDILKRRGKTLDSQVDSIDAMIKDLKAEASFFNDTAFEAAEGLVEIREDYVDDNYNKGKSKPGLLKPDVPSFGEADKGKAAIDDDGYARMMARLDELEMEEHAAKSGNGSDENDKIDETYYRSPIDNSHQNSADLQPSIPLEQIKSKVILEEFPVKPLYQEDITDQSNCPGLAVPSEVKEGKKSAKRVSFNLGDRHPIHPEPKQVVQAATTSEVQHQVSRPSFGSQKAFTGSIVEHAENIQTTSKEQSTNSSQVSSSQPSKPVSRFKMQRR